MKIIFKYVSRCERVLQRIIYFLDNQRRWLCNGAHAGHFLSINSLKKTLLNRSENTPQKKFDSSFTVIHFKLNNGISTEISWKRGWR